MRHGGRGEGGGGGGEGGNSRNIENRTDTKDAIYDLAAGSL